ncbi:MAG: ATP-binding protein [Desulfuromonadaceae bacterium]|nr:ATP-binding protein [Desulfuromonadaceae bacterium]
MQQSLLLLRGLEDSRRYLPDHHESGSLIITSNQPSSQWDQIFPDALMTVAAIDRIIHHASNIEIEGGIYRKKQHLRK